MDIAGNLKEAGLSDGETKVYLALLKLGSSQVSSIKEETKLHRTTIYDFVEKLINKGLASYVIKNNIKYYNAANPEKLIDYIKEKEEKIKQTLPELKKLSEFQKEEIKVEVYKGEEGFKTVLNDIIKTGKDLCSLGIDEAEFRKRFPTFMEQYFRKEAEAGIKERLITSEEARFKYSKKTTSYRHIPKEFFNPTPTATYGNKTISIIWEPLTVIMIDNKELADSNRKHFELLWKMASHKPNKK